MLGKESVASCYTAENRLRRYRRITHVNLGSRCIATENILRRNEAKDNRKIPWSVLPFGPVAEATDPPRMLTQCVPRCQPTLGGWAGSRCDENVMLRESCAVQANPGQRNSKQRARVASHPFCCFYCAGSASGSLETRGVGFHAGQQSLSLLNQVVCGSAWNGRAGVLRCFQHR
jgi:hypothetical protein